jgi:hypothetical protein
MRIGFVSVEQLSLSNPIRNHLQRDWTKMLRLREQVRLGVVIDDLRISMEMLTCSQLWLLSFWILGNALWRVVGTICTFCYECLMGSLREEDQREFDQDSIGLHAPGYLKTQQDKLTNLWWGRDVRVVRVQFRGIPRCSKQSHQLGLQVSKGDCKERRRIGFVVV